MVKVKNDDGKSQDQSKSSFLLKTGKVIKKGGKVVAEEFKYFIDPRNWNDSGDKIRHEAKQAFNKALGNPTKKYTPSARDVQNKNTSQATKDLSVKVKLVDYENGIMTFDASRVLAGDVFHLTDEQLNQIKELNKKSEYSKIAVNRQEGKIVIEVDVEKIINDIEADSKNKSKEEIRELAIARIKQEVDSSLKKFGGITGGEFKLHTDLKLLDAIRKALYREDVSQKKNLEKASEVVEPVKSGKPSETETLRSVNNEQTLSETFKRLVDDGSLPEIAEPLVNHGKRKMESSEDDGQRKKQKTESQEVLISKTAELSDTAGPPVNNSREKARKAVEEAAERKKQLGQSAGLDSGDLKQIFQHGQQLTGGCGLEADSKWLEKQGQKIEPQGSQGFKR